MKEKELTIRVYYGDLDKKIVINRDETFRAFTEKVNLFCIAIILKATIGSN